MTRMDWFTQRCQTFFAASSASSRQGWWLTLLLAASLFLLLYPILRTIGYQLQSEITGSYISGTHSIALISCPNEETARDIARAIMEKKLAACVNTLPKVSTMYIWKGEIEEATETILEVAKEQATEEATEIILLVKTRTSKISQLSDYVRAMHPFEIPEFISVLIDQGNPTYLRWMEENIPDN